MEKGAVIELIINDFKKIGYEVDYKLLTAADYGVPQMRQRVFIVGNRIKTKNKFPEITSRLVTKLNEIKIDLGANKAILNENYNN